MADPKNEEEVVGKFNQLRQEVQQIWSKINELESEAKEHALVIKTMEPMEKERKCFRLVGGVLVERTVGEVLPAVQKNKEGLEHVLAKLREQLEENKKELSAFQSKYNIRVRSASEIQEERVDQTANQGVLVE